MAEMGFRTVAEMIGRVDRIDTRKALDHWKADGVDLSRLLHQVAARRRRAAAPDDRRRTTASPPRSTTS